MESHADPPESRSVWMVTEPGIEPPDFADGLLPTTRWHCQKIVNALERVFEYFAVEPPPAVLLLYRISLDSPTLHLLNRVRILLPALHLVVVTQQVDRDLIRAALEAGVDAYLIPPVPPNRLLEALDEIGRGGVVLHS